MDVFIRGRIIHFRYVFTGTRIARFRLIFVKCVCVFVYKRIGTHIY